MPNLPNFLKALKLQFKPVDDAKILIQAIDLCIEAIDTIETDRELAKEKMQQFSILKSNVIKHKNKLLSRIKKTDVENYTDMYTTLMTDYKDPALFMRRSLETGRFNGAPVNEGAQDAIADSLSFSEEGSPFIHIGPAISETSSD
ncbi:hypothetical protein JR316_0006378 [Psilocybe cubensis]|uniref:Uncharacterized protein n=1 Tax=Psilocybe cubensis TaxID=181762 RepID=A0ACB8H1H3_PSICU|nr:hypothetical protein JR316_0006378 [Psilocybe cubensis]KAH9481848.1 hypothetical protein JR316_0006378 [Psilocybe cubensis]